MLAAVLLGHTGPDYLFSVSSGRAWKASVQQLTMLFNAFAQGSTLDSAAFEATMVACALLLQKPHRSSMARDHAATLECCLISWTNGDIDGFVWERRTFQNHLAHSTKKKESRQSGNHSYSMFGKLMMEGNVHSGLRFLNDNPTSGLLSRQEVPLYLITDQQPPCETFYEKKTHAVTMPTRTQWYSPQIPFLSMYTQCFLTAYQGQSFDQQLCKQRVVLDPLDWTQQAGASSAQPFNVTQVTSAHGRSRCNQAPVYNIRGSQELVCIYSMQSDPIK